MSEQDHEVVKRFKRTKRMQMTAIAGVCVALGIILGMLTSFLGLDEGEEGEKKEPIQASTGQGNSPLVPKEIKKNPAEEKQPEIEVVNVVVDGEQYYLLASEEGAENTQVSLEEIIEKTKQAKGDKNGVKIQIKVLKSARYLTENAIKEALSDAEISSSAIAIVEE